MNDEKFRTWLLGEVDKLLKNDNSFEANHIREYLSFNPTIRAAPLGDLSYAYAMLKWRKERDKE